MLFIPPYIDIDNVSTQVKYKTEYIETFSTWLYSEVIEDDKTLNLTHLLMNKTTTQIDVKESFIDSNSTWSDFIDEDLDVVSKFVFKKKFKVKVKIKSVSKFSPKIVID